MNVDIPPAADWCVDLLVLPRLPEPTARTNPMDTQSFHFPASEAGRLLHVAQMFSRAPDLPKETKQIYRVWILGYLRYLERNDLGDPEPEYVRAFLDRLATTNKLSEERRQQAAEALIFFHEVILEQEVDDVASRLEALSTQERRNILATISGQERLLARIIFSTELGLAEALRLRVGDVDVKRNEVTITNERGCTLGFTEISDDLARDLDHHLKSVREQYDADLAAGHGAVDLPGGVHEQFPNAHVSWVWQYVFPSTERSIDPVSERECRYPMQPARLLDILKLQTAPRQRAGNEASESAASASASDGAAARPPADSEETSSVPARRNTLVGEWTSIYS